MIRRKIIRPMKVRRKLIPKTRRRRRTKKIMISRVRSSRSRPHKTRKKQG